STDFIIGAPTSDNLGVQVWKGGLTLHTYNLDLQGVRGRTSKDAYIGELYEPRIVKDRDIMVEWLKCDEKNVSNMKAPQVVENDVPEGLKVMEGPAVMKDGKVMVMLMNDGTADEVLIPSGQELVKIREAKPEEKKEMERMREVQGEMLAKDLFSMEEAELPKPRHELFMAAAYQQRSKKEDQARMMPSLIEAIKKAEKESQTTKRWDQNSEEYRELIRKEARANFGGTPEQFKELDARILTPFSDRFWHEGCDAPKIKNFVAKIRPKPNVTPCMRRPYKLSDFDEARLEHRLVSFEKLGQIEQVTPQKATNLSWASPAFIVNKKNDVLGRVVVDYTQVNDRTEDHASIAPDGTRILEKASGKAIHTVLDLVWGFSQFPIDEATKDALTICSSRGLRQWL
ncbi:MAG: hypothetical protein QGH82_04185, partial [Candidatus Woesearchaeota archaeon]|nr:hypothetical protein [Candidatus Woesearchaeota archaeon]